MKCCVYRHYDAGGQLLYIGVTNNVTLRSNAHCTGAKWRYEIARIDVEWFPSREHAKFAEAQAIIAEKPKHNVAWNRQTKKKPVPPRIMCHHPKNENGGKIVPFDGTERDADSHQAFLRPGDSIVFLAGAGFHCELMAFAIENGIDFREWE